MPDEQPCRAALPAITGALSSPGLARRGVRALHLPSGQELVLTEGEHNDKHPFPWFDRDGVAHLAWASKKLGERHDGEPSSYDIFVAKFRRA